MKQGYAFYTNENGVCSYLPFDKDRMIKSDGTSLSTAMEQVKEDAAKKASKK